MADFAETGTSDHVLVAAEKSELSEFILPSFGTLLAGRVLVPSSTSNYFAVDQHFVYQLAQPHLQRIPFDEAWYLRTYPDIRAAVSVGTVASAHQHYIRHGYYEHRMPRRIEVDEAWYLANYRDVGEAIARRSYASAQKHFETAGFREGRLPYAGFQLCRAD